MANTNPLAVMELLGEENVNKIKDSVAEIIIKRFQNDLDDYSTYLIYPPDMTDLVQETIDDTYNKIRKLYRKAVIGINEEYIEKMKEYMSQQFDGDKSLRRKICDLAKKYYWKSNEYGKERKFAEELFEILGITQSEIENEMTNRRVTE